MHPKAGWVAILILTAACWPASADEPVLYMVPANGRYVVQTPFLLDIYLVHQETVYGLGFVFDILPTPPTSDVVVNLNAYSAEFCAGYVAHCHFLYDSYSFLAPWGCPGLSTEWVGSWVVVPWTAGQLYIGFGGGFPCQPPPYYTLRPDGQPLSLTAIPLTVTVDSLPGDCNWDNVVNAYDIDLFIDRLLAGIYDPCAE